MATRKKGLGHFEFTGKCNCQFKERGRKGAHTQARTIPLCLNSDRGLSHVGVAGTSNV